MLFRHQTVPIRLLLESALLSKHRPVQALQRGGHLKLHQELRPTAAKQYLPRLRPNRNRNLQLNLPLKKINLIKVPITYTSGEQVEVYRFSVPAAIAIPLIALFLQAFIPMRLHFFTMFDLPLLVVIFFALARRSPVTGLLTGAAIGILQDGLPHHPIGVYGIANTVVGYGASSL